MKEELLSGLKTFIGCFVFVMVFIILVLIVPREKGHYEYVDLDNNVGIASECSYKFSSIGAGGQGATVCVSYDGTAILVKKYKYVSDGVSTPIKDIFGD